ncbi:Na(+)-translocating NADH-quinone reductase subunit A [Porphyromonas crevioricanis]|uniref:Na(+)-translocating NADH-quinone reductase subunit A n=1 Tax=Porphyromonas crevioricanis TaxID=393921 RepID=A0AB34PII0_9PORP|nr:Na(+)-translocating NADH-quinone reductase subunit A [Porphyromonas crevioricanis]KGN95348.1 Na(+)-translocating NADH-quinone reductase subunit A [Porphyromonas crevioricanis]
MAKVMRIKKGLSLNLKGKAPEERLRPLSPSSTYAVVPDDYPGLLPKLMVREGDRVLAGSPLMYHKGAEELVFTSPVSGEVLSINRGAKRKILSIEIKPDATIEYAPFDISRAANLPADQLRNLLLSSGMWSLLRQRPFDRIADLRQTPRDIFVTAHFTAPLAPRCAYMLAGREAELQAGLSALAKLTQGKVYVAVEPGAFPNLKEVERVEVSGPHPAGLCGTLINKIAPVNKGEMVWTLKATDVAVIGRFLLTGKTDFSRPVALTGSDAAQHGYTELLPGCRVREVFADALCVRKEHERVICGDVLTGRKLDDSNPFFPQGCDQITVIPEGDDVNEFFGWATPGFGKLSHSRSFFSWMSPKSREYVVDARVKGGERAMIMSNEYDKVFALNILPEYLLKAIIAFDIPKMEDLGIYEVAPEDFALCEFVDTSKIEIQHIVRQGLDLLYKEIN